MPIPENPQSRSEQYLNAIATGDNSGLPEYPQSRMEQYLDVIAQNGGGSSGGGRAPMTVTISRSLVEEEYVYTADKTVDEMIEQIEAGGQLFSLFWDNTGVPVSQYHTTEGQKGVVFSRTLAYTHKVSTVNVSIRNAGSGDVVRVQEITCSGSN